MLLLLKIYHVRL